MQNDRIDHGKAFDWGKTSDLYARYRDIYPPLFYEKIAERGLCVKGQKVLDLGTGTGVLPRNMYEYGAEWTGIDISEKQIEQARNLAEQAGKAITFLAGAAEDLAFPDASFDVVTACQCFWYFDLAKLLPKLLRLLKPDGKLVIDQMAWLPDEDALAKKSEELVLKYNPAWTGAGWQGNPIKIPSALAACFDLVDHEEYRLDVPFTRESWHGRMKACRGTGASMSAEELAQWEKEHTEMLKKEVPEAFVIRHYAALAVLTTKK